LHSSQALQMHFHLLKRNHNKRRKMYYLGKKKKHTVKNQIKVNNGGFIIHKVGHKKGRRHDYDFQYL